jgi:hypothetical protein
MNWSSADNAVVYVRRRKWVRTYGLRHASPYSNEGDASDRLPLTYELSKKLKTWQILGVELLDDVVAAALSHVFQEPPDALCRGMARVYADNGQSVRLVKMLTPLLRDTESYAAGFASATLVHLVDFQCQSQLHRMTTSLVKFIEKAGPGNFELNLEPHPPNKNCKNVAEAVLLVVSGWSELRETLPPEVGMFCCSLVAEGVPDAESLIVCGAPLVNCIVRALQKCEMTATVKLQRPLWIVWKG